jgi:EmrB/QacA subfamily drug resistance transporter
MSASANGMPYLHVSAGRARGVDLLVPEELAVGRAAEKAEARLADDPDLSRWHARVTRAPDGALVVQDLQSTNGTYVNGIPIREPHVLRVGDEVWMGSTELQVRVTPPSDLPARFASVVTPPGVAPSDLLPEISLEPARIQVGRWVVLIILALGEFMILLDSTIVNVALPDMSTAIHASLDQLLWIVNAYVVTFAVLLITFGRLGDMVGAKNLFILGLAIFVLASAACGVANDPRLLIAFRVVEAIGGAMMLPQTLSLVTHMFPPESRGQAVGVWGAVAGLSIVCGPVLGGLLTTYISWRAIFFMNVPIGIVAIVASVLLVPRLRLGGRHALDTGGVILVGTGLAALVFGLVEGQKYSWGRITSTLGFDVAGVQVGLWSIPSVLLYGVVLLIAFYLWERRQPEPLLPLGLFGDRNFSIGSFTQGAINFGVLGLFLVGVVYFQSVLGFSAVKSGLALLPLAGAIMVSSPIGGAVVDKPRGKFVLPLGIALIAAGLAGTILEVSPHGKFADTVVPFVLIGLGMGLAFTSLTALAVRNISPAQAGAASGFIETAGQIGCALGTAIVGAVLQLRLVSAEKEQATRLAVQLPSSLRKEFIDSFSHVSGNALNIGSAQTTIDLSGLSKSTAQLVTQLSDEVFQRAYTTAMKVSLIGPVGVAALTVLITFLVRAPKYHRARTIAESGVFSFPKA